MLDFLIKILHPIQLIGYVGMAFAFISYQCKKNKTYFIFQMGCSGLFALQFLLLGGFSGFYLNAIVVLRSLVFSFGEKLHKGYVLFAIEFLFLLSPVLSILVFQEPWWIAVLLFIAQGCATLAMWQGDGKKIRFVQLFMLSPIWLYHNIFYKFSVGGIMGEAFNVSSVVISFIRYRKSGFESK